MGDVGDVVGGGDGGVVKRESPGELALVLLVEVADYLARPVGLHGFDAHCGSAGNGAELLVRAGAQVDDEGEVCEDVGNRGAPARLQRGAADSGVALDVRTEALSIAEPLATIAAALNVDPVGLILGGGEDHALLATFPSADVLPARLTAIAESAKGDQPPQVFLRADRGLDYGRVMRVMGELNRAGLNRVALVTVGED